MQMGGFGLIVSQVYIIGVARLRFYLRYLPTLLQKLLRLSGFLSAVHINVNGLRLLLRCLGLGFDYSQLVRSLLPSLML